MGGAAGLAGGVFKLKARDKRYPLATLLAMAVAARLAGYRGVTAFAEFASRLTQKQLAALRAYYSEKLNRLLPRPSPPSITCWPASL